MIRDKQKVQQVNENVEHYSYLGNLSYLICQYVFFMSICVLCSQATTFILHI